MKLLILCYHLLHSIIVEVLHAVFKSTTGSTCYTLYIVTLDAMFEFLVVYAVTCSLVCRINVLLKMFLKHTALLYSIGCALYSNNQTI